MQGAPVGKEAGDPVRGHGPLQGGQRHARPPGRRPAARRHRRSADRARCVRATRWRGCRATSSSSCARTWTTPTWRTTSPPASARRSPSPSPSRSRAAHHRERGHRVLRAGRGRPRADPSGRRRGHVPGQGQGRRAPPDHRPARAGPGRSDGPACCGICAGRWSEASCAPTISRSCRTTDGRVTGVEALLRWADPIRGLVAAGRDRAARRADPASSPRSGDGCSNRHATTGWAGRTADRGR